MLRRALLLGLALGAAACGYREAPPPPVAIPLGDGLALHATAAPYDSAAHPAARRGGLVETLDGRPFFGADGELPRTMLEAAALEGEGNAKIAVTLRDATAGETFDRLCRIYAFTRRERQVVAALAAGLDTRAAAERLSISRHTLQDHLKSVFAKIGVNSRRELVATLGTWAAST